MLENTCMPELRVFTVEHTDEGSELGRTEPVRLHFSRVPSQGEYVTLQSKDAAIYCVFCVIHHPKESVEEVDADVWAVKTKKKEVVRRFHAVSKEVS